MTSPRPEETGGEVGPLADHPFERPPGYPSGPILCVRCDRPRSEHPQAEREERRAGTTPLVIGKNCEMAPNGEGIVLSAPPATPARIGGRTREEWERSRQVSPYHLAPKDERELIAAAFSALDLARKLEEAEAELARVEEARALMIQTANSGLDQRDAALARAETAEREQANLRDRLSNEQQLAVRLAHERDEARAAASCERDSDGPCGNGPGRDCWMHLTAWASSRLLKEQVAHLRTESALSSSREEVAGWKNALVEHCNPINTWGEVTARFTLQMIEARLREIGCTVDSDASRGEAAAAEKLAEVLRSLEWGVRSWTGAFGACAGCSALQEHGHERGCPLRSALAAYDAVKVQP